MIHFLEKKKILIVTHGFYPQISPRSFRATELAKEFSSQGHAVTIIAPKRKGLDEFLRQNLINFIDLGEVTWKVPQIKTTNKLGILFNRATIRFTDLFFAYPFIQLKYSVSKLLKNEIGYDLLISIAVPFPIHWGVASIWNKKQNIAKVWVADCGDPFMYNRHDTFNKMFYFHYFENKFLRMANYITVPFEEMKLLFNQKYKDKYKVIPQGFNFDSVETESYIQNELPTFAYSGTIVSGHRDPFSLIEFLLEKKINFRFHIFTLQRDQFNRYGDLVGDIIILRDFIPREDLIKELSKMDFLVNVNTDSTNGVINAIPTKLIDYRLSGRPILSYEQSKLPTQLINEFIERNYQNSYVDQAFERYNIKNVAKQFSGLAK